MGMITRVRGKLRNLHMLPRIDQEVRNEKTAETVCLLSVVFLLPYCSRGHIPLVNCDLWSLCTYSCFVLPVLISANYKYPVRWLRNFFSKIPDMCGRWLTYILFILKYIYSPLERCEKVFMKMSNLSNLATQLIFFMMADRVLLCNFGGTVCPEKKVTGLYSLMFYNVIAYCTSYIKELIEKEDWSVTVNMTHHSNIKHVAMSATKIVLEWTKAITFIITVTFMLLVFGLEQGLEHYQPTTLYTFVTWTYYSCTEKVFVELFLHLLVFLRLKSLEALEQFYSPIFLKCYTISLAIILTLFLCIYKQFRFMSVAFYFTVFLQIKDMKTNCLKKLKAERAVLEQFRQATKEEIAEWDDVCAVCLNNMERARVTPCHHLFHANCLRQCLNTSSNCPICKREYNFVY